MQTKTFYNSDGKIVSCVYGDFSIIDFSQWDKLDFVEEQADPDKHWISNKLVLEKLENPAVLVGSTISNIPCNGVLFIDNSEYPITESVVDLDLPSGTYKINLDCFPYLLKSFEVTI